MSERQKTGRNLFSAFFPFRGNCVFPHLYFLPIWSII